MDEPFLVGGATLTAVEVTHLLGAVHLHVPPLRHVNPIDEP